MGGILEKLKTWWDESSSSQRTVTLGGIGLTIALLAGIFMFASRPKFAILYSNLTQSEQATIVTDLQGQGVPVVYDTPGMIQVPADKVREIQMRLTTQGKAPKGSHLGDSDLSTINAMTPPNVEQRQLIAMTEGELAKNIETNPGVRAATVHITRGDQSPFTENDHPPTASVSLITAGLGSITHDQAKGIALLVANGVDGLALKNVVVLDERGQSLFNGADVDQSENLATSKLEMEQMLARKEEGRLQSLLDSTFGVGATKVSVHYEVDLDSKHVKTTKTETKKGQVVRKSTEKMKGGAQAGGVSGTGSNMAPRTGGGKPDDEYENSQVEMSPTVITTDIDSNPAAGTITSMMINVMADSKESRFGDATKLQSLKDFIKNEIGNKASDKDHFKFAVTAVPFDNTTQTQITQAQTDADKTAKMQQILSMLPIAALLLVGILVVKQIGKLGKPALTMVTTADGQMIQVPMVNGQIPGNYAMVNGGEGSLEPMESQAQATFDRSLSQLSDAELAQLNEDGVIYRDSGEVVEVEKIREKKSVHLAAIKQMAKDRPEPTAMLIKTWLAETPQR